MANTTKGIVYPTTANAITPLATHFANLANSVDAALNAYGVVPVANAAARNALFPSPVQGNRVYRQDLGYEENYLAAYNATTNPAGANPAGWYGGIDLARLEMTAAQSTAGTNVTSAVNWGSDTGGSSLWNAGNPSRVTVRRPGTYLVKANIRSDNIGSNEYIIARLRINGGGAIGTSESLAAGGQPGGGYTQAVDTFRLVPGDYIEATTLSSPGNRNITVASTSMTVQRIGG